ncbi:MAG: asparagine synthetase B [Candidatus Thiodiazotropha taylori]|nr:asparagine synthetase B [Candidatus Thiodiazotropha taylori]MCG8079977.1 asparagine synthetase B [Candidatus Thiodiazotropha taylori]MCG8107590.1 asparagine synthetase B [Candidatus Thiodiazotropha taylori]MCG8111580.1 asparagine synthetase B [Candidatus Thiodiazotropha taylori]MCG8124261.1 asparagine synthetase B [Candidatus Thiodiazotropha taylori]
MCGIAGYSGLGDANIPVGALIERMDHRGPDGTGCFVRGSQGIGMSRLHIRGENVPLPFETNNGEKVALNGQVYRVRRSNSETYQSDTVPTAEANAIIDIALRRKEIADGMYAAVAFEEKSKGLFGIRDKFGIKPLFFRNLPEGTAFASELSPLLSLGSPPRLRRQSIDEFLIFGRPLDNHTFYENIYRVPPGTKVVIDAFGVNEQVPLTPANDKLSGGWSPNGLREAIQDSVAMCLDSAQPIGIAVSGGLDSTILALEANELKADQLTTVSIGAGIGDGVNKLSDLKLPGSTWKKWRHCFLEVGPNEYLRYLKAGIGRLSEPTAMTSVGLYEALATASKSCGIKTLLLGEGADELFMGYKSYRDTDRLSMDDNSLLMAFVVPTQHLRVIEKLIGPERVKYTLRKFAAMSPSSGWPDSLRTYEIKSSLVSLLERADHCLMGASIEGRTPFLHGKVPDYALSIGADEHFSEAQGKILLRQAYHGNTHITNRAKVPFRAPFSDWLDKYLYKDVNEIIDSSATRFRSFGVDMKVVQRLLKKSKISEFHKIIFLLLSLSLWAESLNEEYI